MLPELGEQLVVLGRTRDAFLDSVRSGTETQRRFRPSEAAWSMLEVTEHLVLAEEKSLLGVQKGPRPGTRVTVAGHFRMAAVRLVLSTGLRVRVPVPTVVPAGLASLDELQARWEAAHRGLAEAIEPVTALDAGAARFRHPLSGWVTAREGLGFLVSHIRHHAIQVTRIRRAPGFPST